VGLGPDSKGRIFFMAVGGLSCALWLGDTLQMAHRDSAKAQASPVLESVQPRLGERALQSPQIVVVNPSDLEQAPPVATTRPSYGIKPVSVARCNSDFLPKADDQSFSEGKRVNGDQFCGCIARLTASLPTDNATARCYEVWAMRS
jgi:hypothetical protein